VADNACENCHTPHDAGIKPRLLVFDKPEDNCLVCHNGTVAAKNLTAEFNKASTHPVLATSSLHDEAEGFIFSGSRHASCMDCHNPHAVVGGDAKGTGLSGALAQVKGVTVGGAPVKVATHEYEICFRCHAESGSRGSSKVLRQFSQPNNRVEFNPGNASYHPVVAPAKSSQNRTLISTWSGVQQILCTDCHNNDQGPGAGSSGPNGPHGSSYPPILERNLNLLDNQPESVTAYALCYKCHDRTSILNDRSFSKHHTHISDVRAACTTCHDSHGVESQPRLINFNRDYVSPSSNGRLEYISTGLFRGTCSLTCHGFDHRARTYAP
jgi:predicted CXXCH cytochrome family protein